MMTTNNNNKRRKIARSACPLSDFLSGGILAEVATFLAPTSRILFGITITPPPSSPYYIIMGRRKPKTRQWSIAGNDWVALDFGDIEKELAVKLTDEDIKKVLLHIDAAHKLKRLRLTNCVNISGTGLAPLTNSTSIEQIDLSLVELHQNPKLDPVPALSRYSVLPILDSIIVQERNSLKHVQFPHTWRQCDGVKDTVFNEFLIQYNRMMIDRGTGLCERCNLRLEPDHNCLCDCFGLSSYGIQYDTCSVCVKTNNHCWECRHNNSTDVISCRNCQRYYCEKCSIMVECGVCEEYFCSSCIGSIPCAASNCMVIMCDDCRSDYSCNKCLKTWCNDCDDCIDCLRCSESCCRACRVECERCGEKCCRTCATRGDVKKELHTCDDCNKTYCNKCRMLKCQEGESNCKTCVRMISLLLLEKTKTQQAQIEDLNAIHGARVEQLTMRIDSLENENYKIKKSLATINRLSQT